ncbi:hypothetical protein SRHO_G00303280 [Serrasalmus rhombeus]
MALYCHPVEKSDSLQERCLLTLVNFFVLLEATKHLNRLVVHLTFMGGATGYITCSYDQDGVQSSHREWGLCCVRLWLPCCCHHRHVFIACYFVFVIPWGTLLIGHL